MHVVYSTDGGTTWTDGYTYVDGGTWYTYTDRSTTIAVANKSSVIVRIVRGDGWQDASKTWNLDYLTITGEPLDAAKSAISFTKPADVEGIAPTPQSIDINTSFTIPQNYTLYKEGYTLTGWTDGETTFNVGSAYTMTKTVYELTPIFTPNSKSLDDRTEAVTVRWEFRKNEGVPFVSGSAFLVGQANIDGIPLDMKMTIDASKGKFDNSNGDWAQVNPTTYFTIPVRKGSLFSSFTMSKTDKGSFDGVEAGTNNGYNLEYTYSGTNSSMVVGLGACTWYRYIDVTYPVIAISPAKEFTTFCSTSPLDFTSVDGLEAYVVTGSTTTAITLAKVTKVPANTGLILKKTGSAASYNVPVGTATSLAETNKLVGVTEATAFTAGDYLLSDGKFVRGTAGTLAAGKAYLPAASVSAGAREMLLDFGGTTGIHQIESAKQRVEGYYNLAGQRVAQPRKGLYIVNGKKVVIK